MTKKILFVCHGNICRSPMAQCVMQHLVNEAGLAEAFEIDSAATTNDEIGSEIYPFARDQLCEVGVPVVPHRARRVVRTDGAEWDYIVCMDDENLRHLRGQLDNAGFKKVSKLMAFAAGVLPEAPAEERQHARDVADPWYTRNFQTAYDDILAGCTALLDALR